MEGKKSWRTAPPPIPEEKIKHRYAADVVIVGAGHAGTCAARAASEVPGTSVIVLEQQDADDMRFFGGGEIGVVNSKWQAARGMEPIDPLEFANDWQLRSNNRSNYRLIKTFAEKSGAAFDWLIEPLSEEEKNSIYMKHQAGNENWPGSLNGIKTWRGAVTFGPLWLSTVMKMNIQIAVDHGTRFMYGMTACQLTKDGGRVTGVIAENDDGEYCFVEARKGVILAAGDFTGNAEMCHDLLTEIVDFYDEGVEVLGDGQDGSGLRMGYWAGGKVEPRSVPAMGGYFAYPGPGIIGTTGTLFLNKHGVRYCNEHFGMQHITHFAGCCQPNGKLWAIFDASIDEDISYQCPEHSGFDCNKPSIELGQDADPNFVPNITYIQRLHMNMDGAMKAGAEGYDVTKIHMATKNGRLYGAETLETLVQYMYPGDGEAQKNALAAVERYNELCRQGRDEDFGKDPALLHALDQGPYFAYGFVKDSGRPQGIDSYFLRAAVGGLLTDEHQNVLGDGWEPIPGLYATGNNCGGRFGKQYHTPISGVSLGMCHTLGREAGTTVANLP